jgi:hypothetical protein
VKQGLLSENRVELSGIATIMLTEFGLESIDGQSQSSFACPVLFNEDNKEHQRKRSNDKKDVVWNLG